MFATRLKRRNLKQMPKRKKITLKEHFEERNGLRISYHEKVCAERMKTIFKLLDEMRRDIKELKTFMNFGRGAAAIIILIGGLLGSVFYFFTK